MDYTNLQLQAIVHTFTIKGMKIAASNCIYVLKWLIYYFFLLVLVPSMLYVIFGESFEFSLVTVISLLLIAKRLSIFDRLCVICHIGNIKYLSSVIKRYIKYTLWRKWPTRFTANYVTLISVWDIHSSFFITKWNIYPWISSGFMRSWLQTIPKIETCNAVLLLLFQAKVKGLFLYKNGLSSDISHKFRDSGRHSYFWQAGYKIEYSHNHLRFDGSLEQLTELKHYTYDYSFIITNVDKSELTKWRQA